VPSRIASPTVPATGGTLQHRPGHAPQASYPFEEMSSRPVRPVAAAEPLQAVRMMSDRVLVKRPEEDGERRSKGGLLIPATAASVSKRGLWADVVAVGPTVRNVETGDRVLLLPDSGIEVEIRGDEYLLVREREIHAVASDRGDAKTGLYL
jgi:chaperonin GroES